MRCDANVSVRPRGSDQLGTRAEVKNMNSVRSLGRAITYEIARQVDLISSGGTVVQETRHWDEAAGVTSTLRVKEETEDYRYFPDPDLVPVEPAQSWIDEIAASLPELPAVTRSRIAGAYGLAADQVEVLVANGLVPLLEGAAEAGASPLEAANWLTNEVLGWSAEQGLAPADVPLTGADLAELVALVADGTLSKKLARVVLTGVLAGEGSPRAIVADRGLEQISDTDELAAIVDRVIAANTKAADEVRAGNEKAIGALVGGVMRETKGKANPQLVNSLLRERLR